MKNQKKHLLKALLLFLLLLHPLTRSMAMDGKTERKTTDSKTGEHLFHKLDSLEGLKVMARTAEITPVEDGQALELDGLVLFPGQEHGDVGIEVDILAREACYPGIIFRFADDKNYELAYAVPHATNLPDAIQYDPVFNGGNTWQLYNGPPYQATAAVPTGTWFKLRIDVTGRRAIIRVDGQAPLVVETLAHQHSSGTVGLWTFKPALFRNLRISAPKDITGAKGAHPQIPPGTVTSWQLQDGKILECEPTGILNLNRHMPLSPEAVKISRSFHLPAPAKVHIGFGFSDNLALFIDGKEMFRGSNVFKGFKDLPSRGWVTPDRETLELQLPAGNHRVEVELKAAEPFGWGIILTLNGPGLRLS